ERKRVHLTTDGDRLFHLTKQYFEIEQQIEEYLSETSAAIEGELRIIADSAHHVTAILTQFRKKYPKVTISLRVGNTTDIISELRTYNAEIGVVGSVDPGKDLEQLSLGSTEILAFAARGFLPASKRTLTISDLTEQPLIFREEGSKTRAKLVEAAEQQGIDLRPAIVAEGREAVREIVASGAGIGFVSKAEFGHDDRLVQIQLKDAQLDMSETLVHMAQRREVKIIRLFMDVARKTLG
ncbi:MAG: LysR family transcriptional regulator substrate-binding protein, partial [Roseibium sp.]|uniref:LysR family transcriptional regulator substrate-binding protein n=1 Tax=Roseibium sp. TaxID=1936156 RepID=UPI00261D25B4